MGSLISYGTGRPVVIGSTLTLLATGDPVTLIAYQPPIEGDDDGAVTVRLPWGETRDYPPGAVACYIAL